MQGLNAKQYNGMVDCLVKTYQKEGIAGYYKGVAPRMMRVGLDVALTFTIFNQMNDLIIGQYLKTDKKII